MVWAAVESRGVEVVVVHSVAAAVAAGGGEQGAGTDFLHMVL
jgi:hypothetical protein